MEATGASGRGLGANGNSQQSVTVGASSQTIDAHTDSQDSTTAGTEASNQTLGADNNFRGSTMLGAFIQIIDADYDSQDSMKVRASSQTPDNGDISQDFTMVGTEALSQTESAQSSSQILTPYGSPSTARMPEDHRFDSQLTLVPDVTAADSAASTQTLADQDDEMTILDGAIEPIRSILDHKTFVELIEPYSQCESEVDLAMHLTGYGQEGLGKEFDEGLRRMWQLESTTDIGGITEDELSWITERIAGIYDSMECHDSRINARKLRKGLEKCIQTNRTWMVVGGGADWVFVPSMHR